MKSSDSGCSFWIIAGLGALVFIPFLWFLGAIGGAIVAFMQIWAAYETYLAFGAPLGVTALINVVAVVYPLMMLRKREWVGKDMIANNPSYYALNSHERSEVSRRVSISLGLELIGSFVVYPLWVWVFLPIVVDLFNRIW